MRAAEGVLVVPLEVFAAAVERSIVLAVLERAVEL